MDDFEELEDGVGDADGGSIDVADSRLSKGGIGAKGVIGEAGYD